MSEPIRCLACGSSKVASREEEAYVPVPLASPASYLKLVDKCEDCGIEGDFLGANTSRIEAALDSANKASAKEMIDQLSSVGISMAYFERALGLPQRTLARWKSGECSSSGIALLRLVSTYPWLLSVADRRFERQVSLSAVVNAAANALLDRAQPTEHKTQAVGSNEGTVPSSQIEIPRKNYSEGIQ